MGLQFTIRHQTPYRSRIQFKALRGKAETCRKLESILNSSALKVKAEVRVITGSVILLHPKTSIEPSMIAAAVHDALQDNPVHDKALTSGVAQKSIPAEVSQSSNKKNHVSGVTLIASGAYLLYLTLKRTLFAAVSSNIGLFSFPAAATLAISYPIQREAIENLKKTKRLDTGLISTGLLYVSLFTGSVLPAYSIFWLYNLAGWLESRIKTKTRQTVREMLTQDVEKAWLYCDGVEVETEVSALKVGDIIVVHGGSAIYVDGTVIDGNGLVDEATLTGESALVEKKTGDEVFAGTLLINEKLHVRVEKNSEETRLASIVRMIENAENEQGDLQIFSQKFSRTIAPVSLTLFGGILLFSGNFLLAMSVLIITCPCALRLSTSVAVSTAMTRAIKDGVLVKGGKFIEIAAKCDAIGIDKTGTLNAPETELLSIDIRDHRFKEDSLIQIAASLQEYCSDPLGAGVITAAKKRTLDLLKCEDFEPLDAGGKATINGKEIILGRPAALSKYQQYASKTVLAELAEQRQNVICLIADKKPLALFTLGYPLRPDTKAGLARLRALGIRQLTLLTGDTRENSEYLGEELGFDSTLWEQSPEDKAQWITNYRNRHNDSVIAMVGNGVNDTPAFAVSDLSFAVADGGTDISIEYSDIVLRKECLGDVAYLLELGKATEETIKRSYSIAIGCNLAILVAATGGIISPVAGALLHNCTTLLSVVNAASINSPETEESRD
ncbi:cadmium-translocating P-type ATPase [Vibrio sp. JC009]|uniref:heavy metal translocating P-type ATPase n=1 Tax=Vibrio sp. JC009 TaxID=2912314 RepID=UPI0023B1BA96|nr:heavy metal translocating P-type ATPase [Vibrio sp. JC009]WED23928.1 cadmium-translocating P-type ATPase [Vibrio sp. JC009]